MFPASIFAEAMELQETAPEVADAAQVAPQPGAEELVPEPVMEPITEPETESATEPETEPITEPETEAATVTFLCDPKWLTLVVFPAEEEDESAAIAPQEDGTYLLMPGDYAYLAEAEGFDPASCVFTVPQDADPFQVTITMTPCQLEEPPVELAAGVVDSGTCGEKLTCSLSDEGILTISGTGDMKKFFHNSLWSLYKNNFVSDVIEAGVTSIGSNAFDGCSSLTSVTIPEGVTSISRYAFNGHRVL